MAAPPAQGGGYVSEEDEDFVLDAATAAKDDALEQQALGLAPAEADDGPGADATLYERRKHARAKYDKAAREANSEVCAAMRRMDRAWQELCGAEPTVPGSVGWAGLPIAATGAAGTPQKRQRKRHRVDDILFRRATEGGQQRSKARRRATSNVPTLTPVEWVHVATASRVVSSKALSAASAAQAAGQSTGQVRFQQRVKFAGKETTVTRTVKAGSKAAAKLAAAATAAAAAEAVHGSGGGSGGALTVGAVVASIDGKKSISTLDKSSTDWDSFKAAHALGEELTHAQAQGFVDKQQFLARAEAREAAAAKAAANTGRR